MDGEDEDDERTERASALRLLRGVEDGDGELEDSVFSTEVREREVVVDSTLGVRLRGLRRRVCVGEASKAKSARFRRPLKLGEGVPIASRLTSSALIERVLVSAMVAEIVRFF